MTTPRHLRRQARRLHRSGIQPIVLIGDSGKSPASELVFLRIVWRYRSELAPAALAGALFFAGWRLHNAHERRWEIVLGVAVIAAWMVAIFGSRMGLATRVERIYASAVAWPLGPGSARQLRPDRGRRRCHRR